MRTALVTGAARNIGLAVARRLAADGVAVAVNGRDITSLERAVDDLRASGAEAIAVPGDIADEESVAAMVAKVDATWGRLDILVNNAGIRCNGPITQTSVQDWQAVLDTVLTGAFLTTRAALPLMQAHRHGRIVNVAGISGEGGARSRVAMVSAKAGLIGLTKATALEGAPHGITANAVSPGLIDTERPPPLGVAEDAAQHYEHAASRVPVGRAGTTEEVAELCAFLSAETSGFITGQTYSINGGSYL